MQVGIRRLRDHLSEYVALVKAGAEIVVTDRGSPVARLVPHDRGESLEELIAQGLVQRPLSVKRRAAARKRVLPSGDVSSLVAEQRR